MKNPVTTTETDLGDEDHGVFGERARIELAERVERPPRR